MRCYKLKIKNEFFNNPDHCFIIAEAGSNWKASSKRESINRAKKLIDVAAKSGADAIKFQTYNAKSVYVENAGESKYLEKNGIRKKITDIFDEYSMESSMLPILSKHCQKRKILFMSTPFSVDDAKNVNKFVTIHKIASYEINHVKLLEYIAKTKKPVIISTGASNIDEINFAVKLLRKNGCKNIAILQCTAKYPAPIESLNLNTVIQMKKIFKVPIGFSDHSEDPIIGPLTAIGLGATIIEKHFTIDKTLEGPDHFFALNPIELKQMINAIRKSEIARGKKIKKIEPIEKELRQFAVRSIQTIVDIKKGDRFVLDKNYAFLRPGNQKRGEEPRFWRKIEGRISKRNISKGCGILIKDCA